MQFRLRLAHLYPNLMNLYGDRGNITCLKRRCEDRNISLVVDEVGIGGSLEPRHYDLLFVGGGQDREQMRIAADLLQKGEAIREAVADDAPVLAVCGNNGEDGTEGCRTRNAFGTYLHGSLLPKNPGLADTLVGLALERKYGEPVPLAPLDDHFETQAREDAVAIAIRDHLRHRRV